MKLPGTLGTLDFSDWLLGMWSAFITGGASAVVSGFVVAGQDSEHFAIGSSHSFNLMGTVFLMSGFLNMMAFLRNKPAPDVKVVTTTIQTVDKMKPVSPNVVESKIVTTIAETHTEPKP